MKKLPGLLMAAALALATIVVAPAQPAAASGVDVCVGDGFFNTGNPLTLPGSGPGKNTTFNFNFGFGICSDGGALNASGSITGPLGGAYCGSMTGSGTTNRGEQFSFTSAGTVLVFGGAAVGTAQLTPLSRPTGQSSCAYITGALVLL